MAKAPRTNKALSKKVSISRRTGKKWVVAVDPFGDLSIDSIKKFLLPLAQTHGVQLLAAYVLAPASLNWTGDFSGPWISKYKPLSEDKMAELFSDTPEIETTVIPCRQSGLRSSVKALLSFVQKVKAERLILATHARQGLEHFAMGSFAETAILASKIPVLILNPSQTRPGPVKRILVCTDLSRAGVKHALVSATFAKSIGAEVVLFYKQPDPLDPIVQQGVYSLGGGWVSVQNFIDEEVAAKTKEMKNLEDAIRSKGVTVSHLVDSSPESLVDSINSAIQLRKVDMVSVLTQSGVWTSALLGSVARGLVRSSPVPVLVCR